MPDHYEETEDMQVTESGTIVTLALYQRIQISGKNLPKFSKESQGLIGTWFGNFCSIRPIRERDIKTLTNQKKKTFAKKQ